MKSNPALILFESESLSSVRCVVTRALTAHLSFCYSLFLLFSLLSTLSLSYMRACAVSECACVCNSAAFQYIFKRSCNRRKIRYVHAESAATEVNLICEMHIIQFDDNISHVALAGHRLECESSIESSCERIECGAMTTCLWPSRDSLLLSV